MRIRALRGTDYRVAKTLLAARFSAQDVRQFVALWRHRNPKGSLCITHLGCIVGIILLVKNKIEFVAVHARFGAAGLGSTLVRAALARLRADFRTVHLVTANSPFLHRWYAKLGFEFLFTETDAAGVSGDAMIYRFRDKRGT